MNQFISYFRASALIVIALVCSFAAQAQTGVITYQGQLNEGSNVANGTYQMQFSLFDAATNGTQIGSTITNTSVNVAKGIFTVPLDFSPATPFATGAPRFLQIAVKKPAETSYTPLDPRQQVTSAPYAIRTLSATTAGTADALSTNCVSCVTNTQIAAVDGSKVTGGTAISNLDASKLTAGTVPVARIGTNSPTASTFLRGDNTWATASGGGSGASTAYGDGSAGALSVGSGATIDLSTGGTNFNFQYTTITVAAGATLVVPSGTVLRATGNVTINGTITVQTGTADNGGLRPHQGVGISSATSPTGGIGLSLGGAAQLVRLPVYGGGAGARVLVASGGEGGGSFSIRAGGNITVAAGGAVNANGSNAVNPQTAGAGILGTGGGAGGVVVLLAKGSLTVGGTITANGGNGSNGFDGNGGNLEGGGGGGGGGIVILAAAGAPGVTGTVAVNGGSAGTTATGTNANTTAGGGGGASGGSGGSGATTGSTTVASVAAVAGSVGRSLTIVTPAPENLVF